MGKLDLVRRAEVKDVSRIHELLVQVCMVHHEGRPDLFKGPATKYSNSELALMIKDNNAPIFVAVDEKDEVLGYCFTIIEEIKDSLLRESMKTLYIDDLCVDEVCRGEHVGQALYEYVKSFARESGCYNITLHVWECNKNAEMFYRNMGFKPQFTSMEEIL